jgi:hypothetical protein
MNLPRLAILLPLLTACASPPMGPSISCGAAGPNTYYFPSGTFFDPDYQKYIPDNSSADGEKHDAFAREWYSPHLQAMREPSLSCGNSEVTETYRLLVLRTFDEPIAVRISRMDRRYTLDAVVLTGAGGYEPGEIGKRIHRDLTEAEWKHAVDALDRFNFWTAPTVEPWTVSVNPDDPSDITVQSTFDGSQWIIEGRLGNYHVVDRHEELGAIRAVGRIFLDLSGLRIPEEDIY